VCGVRALARVSKTPGKTRACNVYDMDGRWYLVDLPGYGFARASHSDLADFRRLLRRYVETRERLAGAVWLLDIRRDPSEEDLEMGERFAEHSVPLLAAITKADKVTRAHRDARVREILKVIAVPEDQVILTSAQSGEGIKDLRDSIAALVKTVGRLANEHTSP
jgi:GTP-binding protein